MHGASQLSWKSALLTGWVVGMAASAIAQPPGSTGNERTMLAQLGLRSAQPAPAELRDRAALAARLSELEGWLDRAYFSEVATATQDLRSSAILGASSPELYARLEVIAGTAHLALGAAPASRACFQRAVTALPGIELRASLTSPKVLRALARARRERDATHGGAADSTPRWLAGPAPTAPAASGALRPTILCRLHIDAQGKVVEATVQRPRQDLARFEQIALTAVREYRFAPARRAGQPVASWIHFPVQF